MQRSLSENKKRNEKDAKVGCRLKRPLDKRQPDGVTEEHQVKVFLMLFLKFSGLGPYAARILIFRKASA